MSYTQPNFDQNNMMKKDISANLNQKCLILCSKILLNVFHNLSGTVLLPWQQTGFQTSPILKASLQMVPHIAILIVTSSNVINVGTRDLLAIET